MTVQNLIDKLSHCNPDAEVIIDCEGCDFDNVRSDGDKIVWLEIAYRPIDDEVPRTLIRFLTDEQKAVVFGKMPPWDGSPVGVKK